MAWKMFKQRFRKAVHEDILEDVQNNIQKWPETIYKSGRKQYTKVAGNNIQKWPETIYESGRKQYTKVVGNNTVE